MVNNFEILEKKNKLHVKEHLNSPGSIKKGKGGYNTYSITSQSAQKTLKDKENNKEF